MTVAGKWTAEFSETAKLKPGMSAFDLVYAFKNIEIPNAAGSLLNVDAVVIDNTTWKDGFTWTQGDNSIEVKGERECAGIKGLLATYSSKSFGQAQKRTYGVNAKIPLPVYSTFLPRTTPGPTNWWKQREFRSLAHGSCLSEGMILF